LLIVLDANSGKVVKELPIGEGCDGVAFDPVLKNIYSSNGSGTLTIISEVSNNDYQVVKNVPTQKSARTLALDEATHHIFLPAAEFLPQPPEEKGKKRPTMAPGTFRVLVVGE
jgi:DNA-binding beta-propeller fold protein YncE